MEGTKGCITLKINFGEEWNGLSKYAVCYRANSEYSYAVNADGEALISDQAVISTSGEFKVKVLGSNSAGTVVLATNIVVLAINSNKFSGAAGGNLEYPTNDYLATTLAAVQAGNRAIPTEQELMAELPVLEW